MTVWRNIRRLSNAIVRQGVIQPGPVDLLGPVQAVQLTDDVRAVGWQDLVLACDMPTTVPVGSVDIAVFEIRPPGAWFYGVLFTNGTTDSNGATIWPFDWGFTVLPEVRGTATANAFGVAPLASSDPKASTTVTFLGQTSATTLSNANVWPSAILPQLYMENNSSYDFQRSQPNIPFFITQGFLHVFHDTAGGAGAVKWAETIMRFRTFRE